MKGNPHPRARKIESFLHLAQVPPELDDKVVDEKMGQYISFSTRKRAHSKSSRGRERYEALQSYQLSETNYGIYIYIKGERIKLRMDTAPENRYCWNCWGKGHTAKICEKEKKV